jgi:hypothetical protein
MSSDKPTLEIIDNLRSGKIDYDFRTLNKIGSGGQADVYEVKSNID